AMILLALLPVPPKTGDVTAATARNLTNIKAEVLHQALDTILQPLRDVFADGVNIMCADMRTRRCYPILATWLADHMEHVSLFNIQLDSCPVCTIKRHELGVSSQKLAEAGRR